MKTWSAVATALLLGFGAGVAAQRSAATVTMQGTVEDANTIPEEIEYWEIRSGSKETIVITGRKDLPVIRWLRQAKGTSARLSLERAGQASIPR